MVYQPNATRVLPNQLGKGLNSLTVAKFDHPYLNSPAVFNKFNIFKELKTGLDYKRPHQLSMAHFLSDPHRVRISAMQFYWLTV